jgi:hypothetical protein
MVFPEPNPSGDFIGIGPDFGNECCACEKIGSEPGPPIVHWTTDAAYYHESYIDGHFDVCPPCLETGTLVVTSTGTGAVGVTGQLICPCTYTVTCINPLGCDFTGAVESGTGTAVGCGAGGLLQYGVRLEPTDCTLFFPENTCSGDWTLHSETCSPCIPYCTGHSALYAPRATDPVGGVCFPYWCCPCPETGSYSRTASIVVTGSTERYGGCGFSKDVSIESDLGIAICSGENPANEFGIPCFSDVGPYYVRDRPFEKYGWSGYISSGYVDGDGNSCSGNKAVISLCCCETPDSMGDVRSGSTGECHMCNYQFTMNFLNAVESFPPAQCYCPRSTGMGIVTHLVPGQEPPGGGGTTIFNNFEFIDGTCDPFMLEFEATGLYWNCDACANGDQVGDDTVTITVTIT